MKERIQSLLDEIYHSSNPDLLCQGLDNATLAALADYERTYPHCVPRIASVVYRDRMHKRELWYNGDCDTTTPEGPPYSRADCAWAHDPQ